MVERQAFTTWLRAQADRDDAVGDLAQDVRVDPNWPSRGRRLEVFEGYLESHGADLDVLHKAWHEYEGVRNGA